MVDFITSRRFLLESIFCFGFWLSKLTVEHEGTWAKHHARFSAGFFHDQSFLICGMITAVLLTMPGLRHKREMKTGR